MLADPIHEWYSVSFFEALLALKERVRHEKGVGESGDCPRDARNIVPGITSRMVGVYRRDASVISLSLPYASYYIRGSNPPIDPR